MVNWQQISSLESATDMWLTLRDWTLDLRNRFVPYIPRKQARASHGLEHDIEGRGKRNGLPFSILKLTHHLLLFLFTRPNQGEC